MYDREIRAALTAPLEAAGIRVVHEWNVGGSVLDVAAITDRIHAYEIKGPRDSLVRLDGQVRDYSRTFDRCTLVGSVHHVDRATERGIVPEWWGLAVAVPLDPMAPETSGAQIVRVREPQQNPEQTVHGLAWLLYTRELRAVLQRRCLPYKQRGKPAQIREICDALTLDELRPHVIAMLLAREEWKVDGRRSVVPVSPTLRVLRNTTR